MIIEKIQDLEDNATLCCKALTKECIACGRGLSVDEFCAKYPNKYGCPDDAIPEDQVVLYENVNGGG